MCMMIKRQIRYETHRGDVGKINVRISWKAGGSRVVRIEIWVNSLKEMEIKRENIR